MLKFYKLALRDLLHYKTRTILSVTGISIIVAVFIILSSISQGIGEMISETHGNARNLVILDEGHIDACEGLISEDVVSYLRRFSQFSYVSPMIHGFIQSGEKMMAIRVVNLEDYQEVHNFELIEGSLLEEGNYALIGEDLSKLFDLDVGDLIDVVGEEIEIVGIFRTDGIVNSEIWMPMDLGEEIFGRDTHTFVLLQVYGDEDLDAVIEVLKDDPYLENKVDVYTEKANWREMGKQFEQFEDVMFLISIIALFAIIFGIFNVVSMTVTEKTKEIGMLKAIGLKRGEIQEIYVIEGLIQSLSGFVLGISVGVLIVFYLRSYSNVAMVSVSVAPVLTLQNIFLAFFLTLSFALIGAYVPSKRASGIRIIKALRGI
ncbi:MAG: ABC transporter permease [Candidatus Methanofastidiosia archaeon]